jgi:hypothetical protein
MLGEFKQDEIVYQLIILVSNKILPGNLLQIKVRDDQGRATISKKIDAIEFCRLYRPWSGHETVFVKAYKIMAIDEDGKRFTIQALDVNDNPEGNATTVRRKEFLEVFLLPQQITAY